MITGRGPSGPEDDGVSTEALAGPASEAAGGMEPCVTCGAPLAPDQRYCLECGTRRAGTPGPGALVSRERTVSVPGGPAAAAATEIVLPPDAGWRNPTAIIAGVGCLLLAMGVGVLIGHAGKARTITAPAQVITVAGGGGSTATAAFTDDWPSGTSGWTVQLQTLPVASTQPPAVAAAKSAASAKGVAAVGALRSDDYSGLPAGEYIVYSGVYTTKAQATSALAGVKKNFPSASVIQVTQPGSSASASTPTTTSAKANPTPSAAVKALSSASGASYVKKSKALPDAVGTGGAPPPLTHKGTLSAPGTAAGG